MSVKTVDHASMGMKEERNPSLSAFQSCMTVSLLLSDSDSMSFHHEQSALVGGYFRMIREVVYEALHQGWNNLRMISDLKRDDPPVLRWRIRGDVGEVTVQ